MLDDLGLADAIQWTVERQARDTGWKVQLHLDELPERLSPEAETACYRICQEALTNAARHANAHEVRIALRIREDRVELEVADDGVGFDPARYARADERLRHFGLVSMAERAALARGELTVESSVNGGTRVRVSILRRRPADSANEASMREVVDG